LNPEINLTVKSSGLKETVIKTFLDDYKQRESTIAAVIKENPKADVTSLIRDLSSYKEYTMGGKFPGKLPNKMRVAALIQILILLGFVFIVMTKAGIAFEQYYNFGRIGIWFIVVFFILGSVMNVSSPSRKEKLIMGPANIIALISTLVTALN